MGFRIRFNAKFNAHSALRTYSTRTQVFMVLILAIIVCATSSPALQGDLDRLKTLESDGKIPLRDWNNYSPQEKNRLESWWKKDELDSVVHYLSAPQELLRFTKVLTVREQKVPDLRGVNLENRTFKNANLQHYILQGAKLLNCVVDSSVLSNCNLQGATLESASMEYTVLDSADLRGANLNRCVLRGSRCRNTGFVAALLHRAVLDSCDLGGANFTKAFLVDATVVGADLFSARFDSSRISQLSFGQAKNIEWIIWGDTLDTRVTIGEEIQADSTRRFEHYRAAENAYRYLKSIYSQAGFSNLANEFHYRENLVITKRLGHASTGLWDKVTWLSRYVFWETTYGYGSRPWNLLIFSICVIVVFAILFFIMSVIPKTKSGIYECDLYSIRLTRSPKKIVPLARTCLYFSLLSFATFGYGAVKPKQWIQFFQPTPREYKPVKWARVLVGIEAALGIWVFALLVIVLFSGNQ